MLNLQKNEVLNLTKKNPSLNNIMLATGWDVVKKGFFSFQADYDLDLVALLLDKNQKILGKNSLIYFGNQRQTGIYLHGDNRTGEGDGDDEMISVKLDSLPADCHNVIFAVTIYNARSRKQSFAKVKNAYVRLINEDEGNTEICRYNLSEDGGDNTAILFAELNRDGSDWSFKARGELMDATVSSLFDRYK